MNMKISSYFIKANDIQKIIILALCFSICGVYTFGFEKGFLRVKNTDLVDKYNQIVILKGIQIDFGSLRGDIPVHLNSNEKVNSFNDLLMDNIITEYDFFTIKSMGANSIRLSLNTYKDFVDVRDNYSFREQNFKKLDNLIKWAKKIQYICDLKHETNPWRPKYFTCWK